MIDLLELSIPFDASLVEIINDRHALVGIDLRELNLNNLGAKCVYWHDDEDKPRCSDIYHAYESLPTSFTGMALKVHLDGYFFPHITIKASPAKILQGHNVFGSDDMALAFQEMTYWLDVAYPTLYGMLAIEQSEIIKIDVTYMSRVKSPKQVRQAIDFMSRISNGQTKPTKKKKFETTVYWGGATSRLIRQKCYSKYDEFLSQLDDYKKQAKKGDTHARKVVNVMSDERLLEIARNSLRWECTFMKRWLERNDLPTKVIDFIEHQKATPDLLPTLWRRGFSKIFEAIEGQEMIFHDDERILNKLKLEFGKQLASGKISYRKAINLYGFFKQLQAIGYDEIKSQRLYSSSQFNRLVADLCIAGFSKAYLQNLHVVEQGEVIPFVQLINVDFANQTPDWYQEPVSTPKLLAA